ncbi:MAG: FAD-dependent oxidoreductase [Hyphomicrobiaceae bacterium]
MSEIVADVVIVGGGMAGLVAGARAGELGLSVVVLERGSEPHYPCNTRWSGGVLHIAYTDIMADSDRLLSAIERGSDGTADQSQAGAIATNGGRFIEWLQEHGTSFVQTNVEWQQLILAPIRNIRGGLDWKDRGPDQLLDRLTKAVRHRGGQLVLGARAHSLVMNAGRCKGVTADVGGKTRTFAGHAVVLADGGFQANLERLARHVAPKPRQVKQRGAATSFGDGLAMAEAVGAGVTALDKFYGHLLGRDAFGNDDVWPYPEVDALACAGMLVNRSGRRFLDEGGGGIVLANALAKSDDPLGATIIFDAAIWNGPGRSARIPANPALTDAGGKLFVADRIEELAEMAGLSPTHLVASVRSYNDALASGSLGSLSPPRTTQKYEAMAIAAPPFHAIPVCAGITYTMGGVLVDSCSRVVKPDGTVISGLYAAGSITGGLEGGANAAYVGGLAKAGVQGLLAAETIAQVHGTTV